MMVMMIMTTACVFVVLDAFQRHPAQDILMYPQVNISADLEAKYYLHSKEITSSCRSIHSPGALSLKHTKT